MAMIETDYLVVGAGASGLAFVDELIARSDADVVMVDRRDQPGGHWTDAYSFVRLHQPSANFGVNSRALGANAIDTSGTNAGFYERATGAEICGYFRRVLDDLLASGRVRFLPMSDYVGDWAGEHTVVLPVDGPHHHHQGAAPDRRYHLPRSEGAGHPHPVVHGRPGRALHPGGGLADLAEPPGGFTILGAGKTAMDACCWLLEHGVEPDRIRWVRPREVWMMDRASFQPLDLLPGTVEAMARWVECLARAESLPELYGSLEACGELTRLDRTVEPAVFRGPILSRAEMASLGRIERVVRHGRVRHLGAERIVLDEGEIPTGRSEVHVDCTASGFRSAPPRPIFEPGRITLQSLIGGLTTYYAALVGYVEAARDDDSERNRLCPPTPQVTLALDWVHMIRGILRTGTLHGAEPDLAHWNDTVRLSFTCGLSQQLEDPRLTAGLGRWGACADEALKNAEAFLASAGLDR